MVKSQLIHIVASRNPHLYATDIARVVDAILEDITRTLEQGGRVEMTGFGTFSVRHRLPKAGRNPRNGEAVYIIEKMGAYVQGRKRDARTIE